MRVRGISSIATISFGLPSQPVSGVWPETFVPFMVEDSQRTRNEWHLPAASAISKYHSFHQVGSALHVFAFRRPASHRPLKKKHRAFPYFRHRVLRIFPVYSVRKRWQLSLGR